MRRPSIIADQRGASIVEFAIVAPVFFFIIMAILEFGLFMFHKVVIESITMQVGREASLNTTAGTGACAGTTDHYGYIRCYVREKSNYLINGSQVEVNINRVADGGTRVPDICLSSNPPSSRPTSCGNWEEVNGIAGYQGATGSNAGDAGELIEVRVSYPWRVLVPFMTSIIGSEKVDGTGKTQRTGVVMITSSTVFRNEPAAN